MIKKITLATNSHFARGAIEPIGLDPDLDPDLDSDLATISLFLA